MEFKEKPRGDGALINAGFFVLSPKVIADGSDEGTNKRTKISPPPQEEEEDKQDSS